MVLVTGGTGFIGQHLLKQLLANGEKVRGIYRKMPDFILDEKIKNGVEWVQGDVLDINGLVDAMEGVQDVYHCAAIVSFDPKIKKQMMKVNVAGTTNVVNAALESGVRKLGYISSIAAIGRSSFDNHVTEETKWEEGGLNTNYAISKRLAEREVWRGIAEGLNAVIVNPTLVIGTGKWGEGTSQFFSQIWKGLKFYPAGTTGFVDVDDVARIIIALMKSDINAERFILNGENLPHYEFFSMIADRLGKPRPKIKATRLLAELAWREEALRSGLTGSKPILTKETARISEKTYFYDNSKIKNILGVDFTPIRKTIDITGGEFLNFINQKL
jgi:dihydroflavonol-4-reductase